MPDVLLSIIVFACCAWLLLQALRNVRAITKYFVALVSGHLAESSIKKTYSRRLDDIKQAFRRMRKSTTTDSSETSVSTIATAAHPQ